MTSTAPMIERSVRRPAMRAGRAVPLVLAVLAAVALLVPAPTAAAHRRAPDAGRPALQTAADTVVAHGIPGVVVLSRDGRTTRSVVAGTADLATGERVQLRDRFRVGSMTKSFVATVVLQLVGERRVTLEDPVERWLPGLVPGGDQITLRQLLNHTSGLFDYLNDGDATALVPYFGQQDWAYVWQPRQLVAIATAHPPHFPPGTGWSYSNTNYVLLGLVIEAATRRPVDVEVTRRIIRPLGLRHTSFPTTDATISGPHLHGYFINLPPETGLPPTFDVTTFSPSVFSSAGAVISTTPDLARFYRALLSGWLLRPAQQAELRRTVPAGTGMDYGLGVYWVQTACGPAWGHDGSTFGYDTIALMTEDGRHQAVLAINGNRVLTAENHEDVGRAFSIGLCGDQAGVPSPAAESDAASTDSVAPITTPPAIDRLASTWRFGIPD